FPGAQARAAVSLVAPAAARTAEPSGLPRFHSSNTAERRLAHATVRDRARCRKAPGAERNAGTAAAWLARGAPDSSAAPPYVPDDDDAHDRRDDADDAHALDGRLGGLRQRPLGRARKGREDEPFKGQNEAERREEIHHTPAP